MILSEKRICDRMRSQYRCWSARTACEKSTCTFLRVRPRDLSMRLIIEVEAVMPSTECNSTASSSR
jgi:hypothetical protein